MPFDFAPSETLPATTDPTEVYMRRRREAARIWAEVPAEQWDMKDWRNECGTHGRRRS